MRYKFSEITINYDSKRVPLSAKQRESRKGQYPYYGAQGIIDYIDDYIFDGKYLLIAEDGENLRSKKQKVAQLAVGRYWVNNHAHIVQTNEKCLLEYLYYLFNVTDISGYITGSAQPKLSQANLNAIEFELPPVHEQAKVVSILSALDDKIELNQKINENLERQAQMLFKFWFVDFVPFGGNVPDGWKYISFSEFLVPSSIKSDDPSLPMFSVTDSGIFPREEKFKKNLSMANTKSKVINQTDLVFGMSREILNWGIMRHLVGGVSSAYNVYQVDERINTFYLESYMKANSQYFKDLIRPASREGQGIDKNALMQKVLLMPPQTVLKQYYAIEDVLTQTADHALEENRRLAEIRDPLLPKLMSGEIDVSNVHFQVDKL